MLTLLIKHSKKILILLITGAIILSGFTMIIAQEQKEFIRYKIIETSSVRKTEVVIRAGEYVGKPGKRIYVNNQTVRLPNDIPVRNDNDGNGFYVSEADINIKVSKALVSKLKERNVDVQLQIAEDRTQDLNAAGKIANKSNPYLYLSIHHNYFDSNSTGYFAMYNQGDLSSKDVADRLSNSIKNNNMVPQRGNTPNTGYIGELNSINESTDAVLLELGFFSNISELEKICSDEYIDYVSTHLTDEIVELLNNKYR